jgi:hypothetical protein
MELMARATALQEWVSERDQAASRLEPKRFRADGGGERIGFITNGDVAAGEPLLWLPEALAITSVDAEAHPVVGAAARESSPLVALALWLMAERAAGAASAVGGAREGRAAGGIDRAGGGARARGGAEGAVGGAGGGRDAGGCAALPARGVQRGGLLAGILHGGCRAIGFGGLGFRF